MMASDQDFGVPEFSLRNSSLPMLIAEAGIDIENYMLGRSQDDKSVIYLSQLLDRITQGENPEVKNMDNCEVLGHAVSGRKKYEEYWKGKHTSELVLQVNLAAKDLRDFKTLPRSQQEALSSFCDRLCQETAHYHRRYHSRPVSFFHSDFSGL